MKHQISLLKQELNDFFAVVKNLREFTSTHDNIRTKQCHIAEWWSYMLVLTLTYMQNLWQLNLLKKSRSKIPKMQQQRLLRFKTD